jgi:hypothetical protein
MSKTDKTLITGLTIGADPEMFLYSETEEKFVPVCGLVGGTKKEPIPVTKEGHSLQEDNVMVEYTIPPCNTRQEFIDNIIFMKNHINDTILKPKGLISKCIASAKFAFEDLQSDQALEFGCQPDFNAYTFEPNVVNREDILLRTSGGHIHIGYNNPSFPKNIEIVKALDLFVGLPSILLDTDTERRKMYGKAGAYRIKPYGVEYRVLSTFWTDNEKLIAWAFDSVQQAIDFVNMGGIITNEADIIHAINTSDAEAAEDILNEYNIVIDNNIKELTS